MLPTLRVSAHTGCSTGRSPDTACVFLHGLGAQAEDLRHLAEALVLPGTGIEYLFPQAPAMAVTVNGGISMPAWFDILSFRRGARQDTAGIQRATDAVDGIVAELCLQGIVRERVFVGGFSQGGAVALHCASRVSEPLAGTIVLSGYLPLLEELPQAATESGRQTPIFMSHGVEDVVIPLDYATESRDALRQNGFQVAWHEYPLGHSIDRQVLDDLSGWMVKSAAVSK